MICGNCKNEIGKYQDTHHNGLYIQHKYAHECASALKSQLAAEIKDRQDADTRANESIAALSAANVQLARERAKVALAAETIARVRSEEWVSGHTHCRCHLCKCLAVLQSGDALAEIRREVARECARIARAFADAQRWCSDGERVGQKIADDIEAQFGVTE